MRSQRCYPTISDDKDPRACGFSSFFFKSSWRVMGDDFVKGIQKNLEHGGC